jgi:hypothetical protein
MMAIQTQHTKRFTAHFNNQNTVLLADLSDLVAAALDAGAEPSDYVTLVKSASTVTGPRLEIEVTQP